MPSEQTAALLAGDKKPDLLMIKRQNAAGKSVKFEIRDKVPREGSKNWERVVAIVCSGKLWQFKKGYPFSVRNLSSDLRCCLALIVCIRRAVSCASVDTR